MSFGFGFGMAKAAAFLSGPVPSLNLQFAGATTLDPRITFTRASSATYFDSTGVLQRATYNLLTYSAQFDNAAWTATNASVTANAAIAPDGTLTADKLIPNTTSADHSLSQGIGTVPTATTYTVSFYAKAAEYTWCRVNFGGVAGGGYGFFNLATGAIGVVNPGDIATIQSVGNGWYRCSYTRTTATSAGLRADIYAQSADSQFGWAGNGTSGIFIWGAQLEQASTAGPYYATTTAANGAPRFDYNPTTLAPRGLLIEEQRTNLLLRSEEFDNASWTKSQASITANTAIAPDGASTADKIVENTATNPHYFDQATTTTAANHAFSVYLKAGERTAALLYHVQSNVARVFDLSLGALGGVAGLGTPVDSSIVSVGNGWYRCTIVATATAASNQFRVYTMQNLTTYNYTGNGTSGIFVWGAQLEAASTAGPYYATTTAANGAPRFDYNPTTLAPLGLLIEEQRTNSIRNNTMVGAVAGTPGTTPTNWVATAATELTRTVVGTGTENGITYIDLRYSGTVTASRTQYVFFEPNSQIAALNGQTWAGSAYLKIAGGSLANISTIGLQADTRDASIVYVNTPYTTNIIGSLNTTLTRFSGAGNATGATVAWIQPFVYFQTAASGAVDITLRIGLPQLEQGAFATSVIPTTTAAATRAVDSAVMTGSSFSSWYNATEGTLFVDGGTYITYAGTNQFPYLVQIDDGTNNNRITLLQRVLSPYTDQTYVVVVGGVTQAAFDTNTNNGQQKRAVAAKTNDFAFVVGGSVQNTDNSGTMPTVNRMLIGAQAGGINLLNGAIRRIAFYPARLANATLQALTA